MDASVQSALITSATALVSIWMAKKIEFHFAKKNKPDLTDSDYEDIIGPIVENIQRDLQAHRVAYWAAQNGETTLDNYSIKKLSVTAESNAEGVDSVRREMQNVPSFVFKRNLVALRESEEGHIVSNESEIKDDLGRINTAYGCNTMIIFRVHNHKRGKKWTGILCIGFEERERRIDETEIGICALQVSRIEALISKL